MCEQMFYSWRQAVLKSKLGATTKHILVTLGCHMNEMGESCFPSIETLCEETSLSNRSVITHLRLAEEAGFIVSSKHGFSGKKWARNEYKATFPKVNVGNKAVNDVHDLNDKEVNVVHEGSERDDNKAVNDVHTSSSINYPLNHHLRARDALQHEISRDDYPNAWLSKWLFERKIKSQNTSDPRLLKLVKDDVPLDHLEHAIQQARLYKPWPEIIPLSYLISILNNMSKQKVDNSWALSHEGIDRMARELGMQALQSESYQQFAARIKQRLAEQRSHQTDMAAA